MKKLAIVDNSLWPEIYNPVKHWTSWIDLPYRAFRAVEGQWPSLEEGYTHLIITGSEASIVDQDPWVIPEIELIREAVKRGLTILGSCYGHQLLALALAGPKSVRRAAQPEIGWIEIEVLKEDELFGPKSKLFVFSSHYDEVYNLDEKQFEIIARSKKCPVQAFRLKGHKVWGIQAHPEIKPGEARKLLTGMLEKNFSSIDLIKEALSSAGRDSGWIKQISLNFARF
ncbi:MAG: type 1 glutamine amidotransferase [Candidatus Saccharicenans sp.]